jgi:hypothetical protein
MVLGFGPACPQKVDLWYNPLPRPLKGDFSEELSLRCGIAKAQQYHW